MKTSILTALSLTASLLYAADPVPPEKVNCAGAIKDFGSCCLEWKPDSAKEIIGLYHCVSITDGSSTLQLTSAGAKGDSVVSGKLETKWVDSSSSVITFSRGELELKKAPHFTAGRDVITGWLVKFTDPDKAGAKPQPAIIIGEDIYVLTDNH